MKTQESVKQTVREIIENLIFDLEQHLGKVSVSYIGRRDLFLKKLDRHKTTLAREEVKRKELVDALAEKELELFGLRDEGGETEALQKDLRELQQNLSLVHESIADLKEKHINPCKEDLKAVRQKLGDEVKNAAEAHRKLHWNVAIEELGKAMVDIAAAYDTTWRAVGEKHDMRIGKIGYGDMPLPTFMTRETCNLVCAFTEGRYLSR